MGDETSFTMVRYMKSIYGMVQTTCCLYTIYYNLFILLHLVEAGCNTGELCAGGLTLR